jgi:acetyl-CoA C-acetyltransferase
MSAKAYISGIFEHPTRNAVGKSLAQLHAECAAGALEDAGLSRDDVDGYFCAMDAPGLGAFNMVDYLGLNIRHVDSTETGGSAYLNHIIHAQDAIASGKCNVALITGAGRPRAGAKTYGIPTVLDQPDLAFEQPYGLVTVTLYALAAQRHMHEFGTTSEQLAWVKVAASHHAQHNPHAMLRDVVTVGQVLASPMISDPLRMMDCCVVSDGGGAIVITRPEIARSLKKPQIKVRGSGLALKTQRGGSIDLTFSGAASSGPAAFAEARVGPSDIKYASIYDSFTITVVMTLEDLGFCKKGEGGRFVMDGNLISGVGKLPFNTDGGGLCNNHPGGKGGMPKTIEAVRQLRGESHPKVQVANCDVALVHGTGGFLGSRHASVTLILERE